MELEVIQDMLNDAMEMVQGAEQFPPTIDVDTTDAVARILAEWIEKIGAETETESAQDVTTIAIACAYVAGRLESMQDNVQGETLTYNVEPTHPEGQHVTINFNFR